MKTDSLIGIIFFKWKPIYHHVSPSSDIVIDLLKIMISWTWRGNKSWQNNMAPWWNLMYGACTHAQRAQNGEINLGCHFQQKSARKDC